MTDSDIEWIVNRDPRFSAPLFGEYMAADEPRQETILRNAKYERVSPVVAYRDVSHSVARFAVSRSQNDLAACQVLLEKKRDGATPGPAGDRMEHQLAALEAFWANHNAMQLTGVEAHYVSTKLPKLSLSGVEISVFPTVWLTQRRARGSDLAGAVIVDLAKGKPAKSEEKKKERTEAMIWTSYLLHAMVEGHRCGERQLSR